MHHWEEWIRTAQTLTLNSSYLKNLFIGPEIIYSVKSGGDSVVFSEEDCVHGGQSWLLVQSIVAAHEADVSGQRSAVFLLVSLRQSLFQPS